MIDKAVFSLFISSAKVYFRSVFTVGEYDIQKFGVSPEQIIKINPNSNIWDATSKVSINGLKVSDKSYDTVFSTGDDFISLPKDLYEIYAKAYNQPGLTCYDYGYMVCNCTVEKYEQFPIISLRFANDVEVDISPYNCTFEYYERCHLFIRKSDDDKLILGLPFFRRYYTVFDMDERLIRVSRAAMNWETTSDMNIYKGGLAAISVIGIIGVILLRNRREDYRRLA